MIVYGDPSFSSTTALQIRKLRAQIDAARTRGISRPVGLDTWRMLLIQAGQLEQAVDDAMNFPSSREAGAALSWLCRRLTAQAASAFVERWKSGLSMQAGGAASPELLLPLLDEAERQPSISVKVKVPEGFAFYGLLPEQYAEAADRWLTDHPGARGLGVTVIGVRSPGTTLSAVVSAALRRRGCRVRRLTVRPEGHPFDRRAALQPSDLPGAAHLLVVDEGPGLSGSSMAAVARAACAAGCRPELISFLPGHAGEPGYAASQDIREWWARVKRYCVPLEELRWAGRSLTECLSISCRADACDDSVPRIEDLGGGLWRDLLFPDGHHRPPAILPFERPKYRCAARNGQSVLWKFAGLADGGEGPLARTARARLETRAARGWTSPPVGEAFGFIATPWVEGTLLTRESATPPILREIGRYVKEAAGGPLSRCELREARSRLDEMVRWNVRETLGESAAERVGLLGDAVDGVPPAGERQCYGDGRMAPLEWVRTAEGRLLKTDAAGHDLDHTMVGRQPLWWDVAGAAVEWRLQGRLLADLVASSLGSEPVTTGDPTLAYYRIAYAAFRSGQCELARQSTGDPADRRLLQQAGEFYRDEITGQLADSARGALTGARSQGCC